jgi:RNA polymerase sigma-54 factor
MKQTLQLKVSQQLSLTPQLQQSIRLLQLSTHELNQEIERIVQENPMLELGDSGNDWDVRAEDQVVPVSTGLPDSEKEPVSAAPEIENVGSVEIDQNRVSDDFQAYDSYRGGRENSEEDNDGIPLAANPLSLREHLNLQISLSQATEREKKIVGLLIDSLDENGYFKQDLNELIDLLPQELEIGASNLQAALAHLQLLDPPGVGARDLKECLAIQLRALPEDTPYRDQALMLVNDHLDKLASHDFVQIKKLLGCDDDKMRSIHSLIVSLDPKPGAVFSGSTARYIVPDVVVTKIKGVWVANLNPEAMPRLSINRLYADILRGNRDDSARRLSDQLNEAKWLIKNIHQRANTILRVSSAIVGRQRQFFEHGEIAMRPLVLREIADILELHESTVSRVTAQKFMRTPRGIFELRYFFGSHVATDSGGACSATAIRALIKQLVQEENIKKPLSDSKISELLEKQGIVVARRTVAKYRELMQIPPANLRKSF